MLLFTFVFGTIAKLPSEGVPYPLFTFTALLPWTLFSNACTFASNSLVQQMPVISKVYFPRLIIPIASTLSWLVDFFISFALLLVMMLFYGCLPGWKVAFLPLFLILAVAFALGIGFCTASLAVKYRDVQFVITYGLRAFMYLTPVAYSGTLVPAEWQWAYKLNPLYWVIEGFRWAASRHRGGAHVGNGATGCDHRLHAHLRRAPVSAHRAISGGSAVSEWWCEHA